MMSVGNIIPHFPHISVYYINTLVLYNVRVFNVGWLKIALLYPIGQYWDSTFYSLERSFFTLVLDICAWFSYRLWAINHKFFNQHTFALFLPKKILDQTPYIQLELKITFSFSSIAAYCSLLQPVAEHWIPIAAPLPQSPGALEPFKLNKTDRSWVSYLISNH